MAYNQDITLILSHQRSTEKGVRYVVSNVEERKDLIAAMKRVYEGNYYAYTHRIE